MGRESQLFPATEPAVVGDKMYGELALFSGRAHPQLAAEIAGYLSTELRGADVFDFPNENIFVRLHNSVRSQDVFIIQPMAKPVSHCILELLIFIDCLKRDSAGRITAVVPYYAYGRTDKKDQPRVPITARLLADLITVAGADRFLTIDLHAGQIQGFFAMPMDDITAFHLLVDHMRGRDLAPAVVVSPDIGAAKKGRNLAEELDVPLALVEKRRSGGATEQLSLIGEVRDCNAIIFDDEIDTAGTVVGAAHLLKERGARDIYVVAAHGVFSRPAAERLAEAPITELVVTNTLPGASQTGLPNVTVLSVASLLGEVIRRIHVGVSVGAMFNE